MMTLTEKALRLATAAHKDQVRKSDGSPYITHPVMVGMLLKEYGFSEAVVAAGFTHDVLEDTSVTREELAAIDEEIVLGALGPVQPGKSHCFEDQYICTGGQLYELMAGRDRFVADLRPLMETLLARRGLQLGICCHPYDLCTALIAQEMGVVLTNETGGVLDAPLTVEADVGWVGYANPAIQQQIEPLLRAALARRGLFFQ